MISLDDLRRYSLFGGLADEHLDFIKSIITRERIDPGEVIFEEGSSGDDVYFILEGEVAVTVDGHRVETLGEGEQFGEMHMIDIQTRSATVTALRPTVLLKLRHEDFHAIKKRCAESYIMLLMNCGREVSRRLRKTNRKLVEYLQRHSPGGDEAKG